MMGFVPSSFSGLRSRTQGRSVSVRPPAAARRLTVRAVATAPVQTEEKLGVLLLNLGGPERPEDVEGFLYNLFSDPDIIRLPPALSPIQGFLAGEIARARAPKSRAAYESIGGGSPIRRITSEQADALATALQQKGYPDAKVYVGMRYWHPFTEEAVDEIKKDGVSKLVVLPLYPQYSISTSGSSLRVLDKIFKEDIQTWNSKNVDHTVITDWYNRDGYKQAMASLISKSIAELTDEQKSSMTVMFSAHGVPESYIEAGDPYQKQIQECCKGVMELVGSEVSWTLCYQSRVGPVKWLSPYTDEVIEELAESGLKTLVVVPVSFVSEHIETLEEIDIEYRELALEKGIETFQRVPALGLDESFISDLGDMVIEAKQQPSLKVTEAMALSAGEATKAEEVCLVTSAFDVLQ
uniref:Ferrochelatase n=2 Tax=Rhodosorus marinus TaxID=101924 RepID=A0A7S2ZPZ6_9RHOD|mmetsp:Transcript_27733/g.108767  ORF Transcript_27733/g.108767 Transcript_27733/m.108767 type:complete len:409 (+) Transcript_27733:258-1484(+)